jgi:hypothetical protein
MKLRCCELLIPHAKAGTRTRTGSPLDPKSGRLPSKTMRSLAGVAPSGNERYEIGA